MNPIGTRKRSAFLLCKSFRTVSFSGTELHDLRNFVGDATGIMPVCFGRNVPPR